MGMFCSSNSSLFFFFILADRLRQWTTSETTRIRPAKIVTHRKEEDIKTVTETAHKLDCEKCFGHGVDRSKDPRCEKGCGKIRTVTPTELIGSTDPHTMESTTRFDNSSTTSNSPDDIDNLFNDKSSGIGPTKLTITALKTTSLPVRLFDENIIDPKFIDDNNRLLHTGKQTLNPKSKIGKNESSIHKRMSNHFIKERNKGNYFLRYLLTSFGICALICILLVTFAYRCVKAR